MKAKKKAEGHLKESPLAQFWAQPKVQGRAQAPRNHYGRLGDSVAEPIGNEFPANPRACSRAKQLKAFSARCQT